MDSLAQTKRKRRIRARITGTAARPRASVFRSLRRLSVQLIDDTAARTLASASGEPEAVGVAVAAAATKLGIKAIVFDRAGYRYHGRVKAVAEAMRAAGLEF